MATQKKEKMTPEEIQRAIVGAKLNAIDNVDLTPEEVATVCRALLALTEQLHRLGYPPETYGMVKANIQKALTKQQPEPE